MKGRLRGLRRRLRRLFTAKHPLTREIDVRAKPDWVVRRAAVSNTRRYCYFRIPKCANSTILQSLIHHDPDLRVDPDAGVAEKAAAFETLLGAQAASLDVLQRDYYCFTFVRNPYARVLSAYLDKVAPAAAPDPEAQRAEKYGRLAQRIGVDESDGRGSFDRFVGWLEAEGLWLNAHWAPQVALVPMRLARLDHIGRVESLDRDLATVIDAIFGDGAYQRTVSREMNRTGARTKLAKFYTESLAQRVHRLYHDDFEAFGYSAAITAAADAPPDPRQTREG